MTTKLKTIRVKAGTFDKFRSFGVRTQTDDNIVEALVELANRCLIQEGILNYTPQLNKVRDIESVLSGNIKNLSEAKNALF